MNEMIRWMRRSVFWKTTQMIKHYTRNNVEAYCLYTNDWGRSLMIIAEVKFREQKTQTEFPPLLVSLVVLLHPDF